MNLQDFICSNLKDHAALVSAGLSSEQALNIISQPMVTKNLNECLDQLTTDQLDKLVKLLQSGIYFFENRKAVYMICGITSKADVYRVHLSDSVLQIDSFELRIEEIQERMVDDILKHIKQVI